MKNLENKKWIWRVICWGWRRILKTFRHPPIFGRDRETTKSSMGQEVFFSLHSSATRNPFNLENSFATIKNQAALAPLVSLAQKGVVVQFCMKNDKNNVFLGSLIRE